MSVVPSQGTQPGRRDREERLCLSPARRMLATMNCEPGELQEGDFLPALWHRLYFLPEDLTDGLAEDGHPYRGDFMPAVEPPLRMFAGFDLEILQPLVIGERARKGEEVTNIEEKHGRSGRLVFVTVSAMIEGEKGPALKEKELFVYREARPPVGLPEAVEDLAPCDWCMEIELRPTLLFRFSALTFNAHRIHYDRDYATRREGYPGLVVHGPLVALFMAELVRSNSGGAVKHFAFRQRAPVFEGDTLRITGSCRPGEGAEFRAVRGDGVLSATGQCVLV